MPEYLVIGAGISGLTAAYELLKHGKDVVLLEASERVGGNIHSIKKDGYTIEEGPFSIRIENRESEDLIRALNLSDRILPSKPEARNRYIVRNGKPLKLPSNPIQFFTSSFLSFGSKLEVLSEPFQKKGAEDEESVQQFFSRRIGNEAVQYLIEPMVSGTFAGAADALSMKHSFAKFFALEREYGSLLKGMMKGRKTTATAWKRTMPRMLSFRDGLSELPRAIANTLGDRLHLNCDVENIHRSNDTYIVSTSHGEYAAKKIIVATSATVAKKILSEDQVFRTPSYASVAVITLAFKRSDIHHPFAGFGLLAPHVEKRSILGIIFSSSIFPHRAPDGYAVMNVMIGGASVPELVQLPDQELLDIAVQETSDLLEINAAPTLTHLKRWSEGIPQYNVGYEKVLGDLSQIEKNNLGLHFLGNYRGGISIGACIKNATDLATSLV